jgi:hypothetical protein
MEFKTEIQKTCYEKVSQWMTEIFGTAFTTFRDDAPLINYRMGSAIVGVSVYPWGDDEATICARAYVVTGIELTPELMKYLLSENNDMRFGAFGLDQDGDIFFDYTIVGSSADKNELKAAVIGVISTADDYDDQIVAKWGGQRALDRMRS